MVAVCWTLIVLTSLVLVGGCAGGGPGADRVRLTGSVYTDAIIDAPCETQPPPPELAGVQLSFSDDLGRPIGSTVTGAPAVTELPKGVETADWAHGGCRFFAPYAIELPVSTRYTVDFTPSEINRPAGAGYFDGVNQLTRQTTDAADLAAAGFVWNFVAPNAYVVH